MSHWINTPKAVDGKTGRTVFDLMPWSAWDMCNTKESADSLIIELRRYPNGNDTARLEVRRHTLELFVDGTPVAANKLDRALSAALRARPAL